MYTIKSEDGSRDLSIEHGLSGLECLFSILRERKIDKRKRLTKKECFILTAFVAAMECRSKKQRDHHQKQNQEMLKMMDEYINMVNELTPDELKKLALTSPPVGSDTSGRSYEEVRQSADQPMQNFLIPTIPYLTAQLTKMHMTILNTSTEPGFITSDSPCVWFDPNAYKRHPLFRSPGLIYKTIEITMPISPKSLVIFTHYGRHGYVKVNDESTVDDLNRRTRYFCDEYFVVRKNFKKDIWFDHGKPPKDDG